MFLFQMIYFFLLKIRQLFLEKRVRTTVSQRCLVIFNDSEQKRNVAQTARMWFDICAEVWLAALSP